MVCGVIFDLDGTLLDTLDDLTDAVNFALGSHGYPLRTREEVRGFVGDGIGMLIARATDFASNHPEVLQTFRSYYALHFQDKTRPYPGIAEVLSALPYPLAVVSNKLDAAVKPLCRQFFGDIYALGEIQGCPRKPAPDMLLRAMEAIGADACIYVGDSPVDIQTAQNAHIPCLSVTWGFRDAQALLAAGAAHLCHDSSQLPELLGKMFVKYYGN